MQCLFCRLELCATLFPETVPVSIEGTYLGQLHRECVMGWLNRVGNAEAVDARWTAREVAAMLAAGALFLCSCVAYAVWTIAQ